ncbi:hypothetical protein E2320_016445, partial [Naja naja]
ISFLFVVFYFLLDCWQNIFAEILRFADRSFYKLIGGRARAGAMLIVFLLSAVFHEYIFTMSFGFFYPVLFVLFAGTGVFFTFVFNEKRKGPVQNTIIWICLLLGTAIFCSLYCQEWFAHVHCPLKEKTFWGLVTPRSWYCHP